MGTERTYHCHFCHCRAKPKGTREGTRELKIFQKDDSRS